MKFDLLEFSRGCLLGAIAIVGFHSVSVQIAYCITVVVCCTVAESVVFGSDK